MMVGEARLPVRGEWKSSGPSAEADTTRSSSVLSATHTTASVWPCSTWRGRGSSGRRSGEARFRFFRRPPAWGAAITSQMMSRVSRLPAERVLGFD